MDRSPTVYQIEPEEKGPVIGVLTAAFYDYPALRFFLGSDLPDYYEKQRLMVSFFCEARVLKGLPPFLVRHKGAPVAAALVNPAVGIPTPSGLKQAYKALVSEVGTAVIERLDAYEDVCLELAPKIPHYYLGMIGVMPEHQGEGYARQLIEHIHEIVDQDPAKPGICLNTEKLSNVPIYRHFGYEVIGEADVGLLHTWCMFRPSS